MKLFKKLFLQIFLAFLVLSQAVFFYLLYESRRQAVESIQHYEKLSFQGKTGELDQKLRGMYETEEQEIQDRIVASAFRQYVGSQGILYRGTKELFNISAYEYEVEDVFKRTGDRENGLLLKNGERRLLLFWDTLTFGKNYRVLYYKDITEIYQRFDKLFLLQSPERKLLHFFEKRQHLHLFFLDGALSHLIKTGKFQHLHRQSGKPSTLVPDVMKGLLPPPFA